MTAADSLRRAVCSAVGISPTYLYQPLKFSRAADNLKDDIKALAEIAEVYPLYGVRRLADRLNWSIGKTRRIRDLAGIKVKPYKKKRPKPRSRPPAEAPANYLLTLATFDDRGRFHFPQKTLDLINCWTVDFTYLWFKDTWLYLSAVFDLRSRFFLNFSLDYRHRSLEQINLLKQSLSVYPKPEILHSDQGAEYLSKDYRQVLADHGILQSCSEAGSPWQNAHIERAFRTLKDEMGSIGGFKSVSDLRKHVAATTYYYNHGRKHSATKSIPHSYYLKHLPSGQPVVVAQQPVKILVGQYQRSFTRQNTLEKIRP